MGIGKSKAMGCDPKTPMKDHQIRYCIGCITSEDKDDWRMTINLGNGIGYFNSLALKAYEMGAVPKALTLLKDKRPGRADAAAMLLRNLCLDKKVALAIITDHSLVTHLNALCSEGTCFAAKAHAAYALFNTVQGSDESIMAPLFKADVISFVVSSLGGAEEDFSKGRTEKMTEYYMALGEALMVIISHMKGNGEQNDDDTQRQFIRHTKVLQVFLKHVKGMSGDELERAHTVLLNGILFEGWSAELSRLFWDAGVVPKVMELLERPAPADERALFMLVHYCENAEVAKQIKASGLLLKLDAYADTIKDNTAQVAGFQVSMSRVQAVAKVHEKISWA